MGMIAINEKRDRKICELFLSGKSSTDIGKKFLITRSRVQQILSDAGYTAKDGGVSIIRKAKREKRQKKDDIERMERIYRREQYLGMSIEQYNELLTWQPAPYYIYMRQHCNAQQRNIEWHLTFGEWWRIWNESGFWPLHGRGFGCYVMTRKDFTKGFTLDNVVIKSFNDFLDNPTIKRTKRNGSNRKHRRKSANHSSRK